MSIYTVNDAKQEKKLRKRCSRPKNLQSTEMILLRQQMDQICKRKGVAGVAANQLGYNVRIFALTGGRDEQDNPLPTLFFYNPRILEVSAEEEREAEGCLSVPGRGGFLSRPKSITLAWEDELGRRYNKHGQKYQYTFTGFWARAVEHEMDHLDGKLYIDKCDETFDESEMRAKFEAAQKSQIEEIAKAAEVEMSADLDAMRKEPTE